MPGGWLEELKQRRVFRALLGYGLVAFALLQVVEPVMHGFRLPEWVLAATVIALGLGFPITLVLAWIFDLRGGHVETTLPRPPRRGVLLLVALGLLLAAPGVGWYFWRQPRAAPTPTAEGQSVAGPPSIAVLAFADLSPGKDQEYFADGISEEILNALTRVKGLKVAGRTSAFHFKGKNEDLRTIGQALGVANVLEGSVRKQGNKVRITAQLIQASDGFHRWSKNYDGDLSDVFELQDRIARAITDELQVVLQGEQQVRLVPVATRNPEAYALYLQATAIFNRRDGARFADAITALERALTLDPVFARAHSRLATLHAVQPAYRPSSLDASLAAAERHARRAIELDADLAEPHAVLGLVFSHQRRHREERAAFQRALELDPDDVTANFWFGITLLQEGYQRDGKRALDHVLAIDPMLPNGLLWRGNAYFYDGDLETAERMLRRSADLGLAFAGLGLSSTAAARGQREEAVALIGAALQGFSAGFPPGSVETIARGLFGDAAERARGVAVVDAYLATRPAVISGLAPFALVRLGEPARALELVAPRPTANDATYFGMLWSPFGKATRALPQFPEFLRRIGLADLWEQHGPPEGCRRLAPRDYVCE
jgi:TolB-like protein/Tfp pilus assembly protein PilF